jgi:MFS family permease
MSDPSTEPGGPVRGPEPEKKGGSGFGALPTAIRVVVVAAGVLNVGTFAIAPYLALHMLSLDYTAWEVGSVLAANLVTARCLPLLSGLVGDRTRHVTLMTLGLALRGAAFAAFAVDDGFWWYLLCSSLVGLSGALYEPSASAVMAAQSDEVRKRGFSFLNQAQNLGAVLGPAIGALLIGVDARLLFVVGGALMLLFTVPVHLVRRHLSTSTTDETVIGSLGRVFRNGLFLRFGLAMGLFWVIDSQLTTSLPIYASELSGYDELAGAVLMVNGIAGVLAVIALRRQFERRAALVLSAVGMAVVTVSIGAIAVVPALLWLLLCVVVYSIGETLVFVSADIYIADLADQRDAGAFFGGHDVFWAVGGAVGFFLGAGIDGGPLSWLGLALLPALALALIAGNARTGRRVGTRA